eukprot:gb/GECG01015760.1/.p1 GENE.gb/GECG01015760.1/~~gb/GECG01015760.1/.p1  ORF type:complete len:896 (+),score=99.53 gb/GECG01015760.1/:1-2688(+)
MDELERRLARDINCLKDQDRTKRKSGLKALFQLLEDHDADTQAVGQLFCQTQVGTLLIQLLTDSVERIRESTIDVLEGFLGLSSVRENLADFSKPLLHAIKTQIGEKPFNEPAEELRLRYAQLLHKIIREPACSEEIRGDSFDDIVHIIENASQDSFPQTKQECGRLVESLVRCHPERIHGSVSSLLNPQLGNFVHQRAAVRLAALKAVSLVLTYCKEAGADALKEQVVPKLTMLLFDRSPSVRKELAGAVLQLLAYAPHNIIEDSCASLEYICLSLHADDTDDVSQVCYEKFKELAPKIHENLTSSVTREEEDLTLDERVAAEAASGDATDDTKMAVNNETGNDEGTEADVELPQPFAERPVLSARKAIVHHLGDLVDLCTQGLTEWTAPLRKAAACALRSLLVYAEDNITAYVDKVISSLCRAVQDEEVSIRDLVHDCNALVGAYVPSSGQLGVLLPLIRGELSGLTEPAHKYQGVIVMCDTISGMNFQQVEPHLMEISRALSEPELVNSEITEMPEALYYSIEALIDVGQKSICEYECRSFISRALVNLHREDVTQSLHAKSQTLLRQLTEWSECSCIANMLSKDLKPFLQQELNRVDEWTKGDGGRLFLDAVVRHYPPAVESFCAELAQVFEMCADSKRDRELRLTMMGLLDVFLKTCDVSQRIPEGVPALTQGSIQELHRALSTCIPTILRNTIKPNLVWRPGGVASAMRKITSSCLLSGLQTDLVSTPVIQDCWNDLQQQLLSVLADDDVTTRQIVCMVLQLMFEKGGNSLLNMETTRSVYPELIKRLDDSNDHVRQLICPTLKSFLYAATAENLQGGPIDHTVETLLIHMDDPDRTMQESCFDALCEYAKMDVPYTYKKAKEARQKHRSPVFCDRLLQFCENLQSQTA